MYAALTGPRHYLQGRGTLTELGRHTRPLGTEALVVVDELVWEMVKGPVSASFRAAELTWQRLPFRGECSEREINRIWHQGKQAGSSVVVGIGGGKALDTAKAVGARLGQRWVMVPTIASSNAPTSAVSAIYADEGSYERSMMHPKHPDLILVDTAIIARAPARFLSAGIGTGLATWVEARAAQAVRKPSASGGAPTRTAIGMARLCWDTLMAYGAPALQAVERGAVTPAVEAVVEAIFLAGGLGYANSGTSVAHALAHGMSVLPREAHPNLYGERLAFGALAQLFLEGRPAEEIDQLLDVMRPAHLPTTLYELNMGALGRAELQRIAEAACATGEPNWATPFQVAPETLVEAITDADAYSHSYQATQRAVHLAPASRWNGYSYERGSAVDR